LEGVHDSKVVETGLGALRGISSSQSAQKRGNKRNVESDLFPFNIINTELYLDEHHYHRQITIGRDRKIH
jgi:hypothetical protein